jgi:hypothetical protein
METYRVKIRTAGQKVIHRKKQVRTPVVFNNVTERELLFIQSQARRLKLAYELKKESELNSNPKIDENFISDSISEVDDEIKVEVLEEMKEPTTILEKLISEDKKD